MVCVGHDAEVKIWREVWVAYLEEQVSISYISSNMNNPSPPEY